MALLLSILQINTIPDKGWPAYIYHECPQCKKIYHPEGKMVAATVNLEEEPKKRCEFCDTLMNPKIFIIPLFGFSTQVEYKPRNKVSGQCGCTPETSCYGCLRNYSNQFFHDEISRGIAYEYLDWLLNGVADSKPKPPIKTPAPKPPVSEEIGTKKLNYDGPDVSANPDTLSQLEELLDMSDDESEEIGIKKLIEVAKNGNYENPIINGDSSLPATEGEIWPELFWANSHVALFTEATMNQYKILKKYDWYCYIIDENIDAEVVLSHVKKEG